MELERKLELFREKAREAGLKVTPQRIAIYRELASRNDHPSAEELFESLKNKIEGISLTTVYRTLASLEKAGLVVRVPTLKDKVHYDARVEPHSHFVCVECGAIYDIDIPSEQPFNKLKEEGFEIVNCTVLCYGICKKCKKEVK
ncbi:Fur family transcriptional regulator [Phorcysia thermohydrogeniphila]|uniref:Fur family peroxide stress response transcriptional regulator n=1 Tax=Phorcysia thermohydrogeniphila TaxID=936138 RepID=A0A4R1GCU3_9BACT|nr:Fur family transcriptional regulator [Phorcysia thermohydrogeniphila]TCK04580.1 Fur family peroxide stress response transcriptional regulator [Phorcysia thermohydrogeniphila]